MLPVIAVYIILLCWSPATNHNDYGMTNRQPCLDLACENARK
jgi:hypothetical protein